MKKAFLLIVYVLAIQASYSQTYYFPPATGNQWDAVTPKTLGWCEDKLDTVYRFLEEKNSKGFIILKGGKIAVEKYFGSFTMDSAWYWASVGKSLTAVLVGIAQQEGKLSIDDKASKYLGSGWTECTQQQEDAITLKNLLTMTSGLNDLLLPNPDCTDPKCFKYKADAGTRWAYHSGAYYMLHTVIDSATGFNINQYTNQKLRNTIGMQGLWAGTLYLSTVRDMARLGSLMLNKGVWSGTAILSDAAYYNAMINSSQTINPAYGYLWWLNGKSSYKRPLFQNSINGELVPNAPNDMYAGMGKNEQRLYIIPSMDMVVVRMGDPTGQPALAVAEFDNELWGLLNNVFCNKVAVNAVLSNANVKIYPNPATNKLIIETTETCDVEIFSINGKQVLKTKIDSGDTIDVNALNKGIYTIKLTNKHSVFTTKFVKQ